MSELAYRTLYDKGQSTLPHKGVPVLIVPPVLAPEAWVLCDDSRDCEERAVSPPYLFYFFIL